MPQLTVLVVDDEPGVRAVLTAMVSSLGYRTVPAASGTEAAERCREYTPDVVVLDVRMPEVDGPATLDVLRALAPNLPCVFVSGDPRPHTVPELLARGRVGFLAKPVGVDQLGAGLHRVMVQASAYKS